LDFPYWFVLLMYWVVRVKIVINKLEEHVVNLLKTIPGINTFRPLSWWCDWSRSRCNLWRKCVHHWESWSTSNLVSSLWEIMHIASLLT
jgi:hypothetical protein